MDTNIKKRDQVYTLDKKHLGAAHRLYHRIDEVRPGLQLYARYLLVQSFIQGDQFYIPTDFVANRDAQTGDIVLSVTEKSVEKRTWTRLPDFILHGEARSEELADSTHDAS